MKFQADSSGERRDRIGGALLGLAVGDALGGPVEYLSRDQIAARLPGGVVDFVAGPSADWQLGQVTDDTEMALVTMASLVERNAFDMDDIAQRFVAWGKTAKRMGPSSGHALNVLQNGGHWSSSGSSMKPSSGCLPRCAPLALVIGDEDLVSATTVCCRMTHTHPLAVAATVAQNIVLERLVRGGSWDAAMRELYGGLFDIEAGTFIRSAIEGKSAAPGAVDVLAEAMRLVGSAQDGQEAIAASVTFGGDTDTRGAVAGALAGARWGTKTLPARWIEKCLAAKQVIQLCADLR